MLQSIREFAESERAIYAECGGLMYLAKGIVTRDATRHELVGLLPAWTKMLERLKALGYVEVTLTRDSLFGPAGMQLRGHEFHYSEFNEDPGESTEWATAYQVRHRRGEKALCEGYQRGRILVSYIHMHFASRPESVDYFVAACRR
jgi:cobyrinic acid a,c-diamide synthase